MRLVIATVLAIVTGAVYLWKLPQAFNVDTDFGRDLYDTLKIAKGHPSLIGPPLTGAVFAGPYYYYYLLPALDWVLVFNALVFVVGIGVFYVIYPSVWAALAIGLWPSFITSARHPGNAYSYLPWLLILLTLAWKKRGGLVWGGLAGIVLNFHPATMAIILPSTWRVRKRALAVLGIALTFLPLLAFEARHDWVMTRAVISGKFWRLVQERQVESHYLLPVWFGLLVWGAIAVRPKWLLGPVVLVWIVNFPRAAYTPSTRPLAMYEKAVNEVIEKKSLDSPFNVLAVTDLAMKVPAGNIYRYFFLKKGYSPLPATNYASAKKLIVFQEDPTVDLGSISNWELQQFKGEKFVQPVLSP